MGDVVVVVKVLPKDVGLFDKMKEDVLKSITYKVTHTEEEPIAFGLKAFNVTLVMPDAEGGTDKIEKELKGIESVGDVQIVGVARTM
ncbi:MAG: elongation factor 1-beta [Candidatus Diapherotrites archaeon]|nr:elongation factor 1-beta [Candidatus Diapherotrites archaeon]